MNIKYLLAPVLLQVFLTFFLAVRLLKLRVGSLRKGETKMADIALAQRNWPDYVLKAERSFHNQLETPILFYVLTCFIAVTQKNNLGFVVMAWLYMAFRFLHAYEHNGDNNVKQRFKYFAVTFFILIAMWLYFAFLIFI